MTASWWLAPWSSDLSLSVVALLGGLAVGWAFFYGLLRTVRMLPGSEHPARLLALSLVMRLALLAGAGWLLLQVGGGWVQILLALAGVMLMRLLILRRSLPPTSPPTQPVSRPARSTRG